MVVRRIRKLISTKNRDLPLSSVHHNPKRVIVVGSGITGLCAGALLAKLGHHVTILEAHPELIGGHARSLDIGGLRFCAGPQFVWNFVSEPNMIGTRVLRFLDLDHSVLFESLDTRCQDRLFLGSDSGVDVPRGLEKFLQVLINRFPKDESNLKQFFTYIESLFKGTILLHDQGKYLDGRREILLSILTSSSLSLKEKWHIGQLYDKTLLDVFDLCELSDKPRRLLYGHGGMFAENVDNISVGIYAAATGYSHLGLAFPRAGFQGFIQALASVIVNYGGNVFVNKRVSELILEGTTIVSVKCADGSLHPCDYVISTLSPRLTCNLIPDCDNLSFKYQPSNSLISCFIGVDNYPGLDSLTRKNFWWQAYPAKVDYDNPDMTRDPTMLFVSSGTKNGILYNDITSTLQGLTVFTPGNFGQAQNVFMRSPRAYDDLKSAIAQNVLNSLEMRLFTGFKRHVEFIEVLTPWDLYQELGAESGNVYGRKADVENALRKTQAIHGVTNLRVACATVGQAGVATGFQTGYLLIQKLAGLVL